MQQSVWIGRTAWDVNIDGDDGVHAAHGGVVHAEDAAAAAARPDGYHETRVGCGVVSFLEREFHVARDGSGHKKHVSVARRGDKVNAETFNVTDRAVEAIDFDFAAVAGAGIHFADVERTAKDFVRTLFDLLTESFEGFALRG